MAETLLRPFAAIRPAEGYAQAVAAPPYDVVSVAEAQQAVAGRPDSFLHVSRAEIDLPEGIDPHDERVYRRAADNLAGMLANGVLIRDPAPAFYAYRMQTNGHTQTGIAAAAPVLAYENGRIRRHEHTRPDKETDRTRQILAVGAHTGPVLAAYPADPEVATVLAHATQGQPVGDATTGDGTRHQIWRLSTPEVLTQLTARFAAMPAVYIADGHHRSAAALRVYRQHGAGDGQLLVIAFPADELQILGYHRIVRDLGGLTVGDFIARLERDFTVAAAGAPVSPQARGTFGLFVGESWYTVTPRQPLASGAGAVERLDVSVLSRLILEPILGIGDPRTDPRIDFVGGGRGVGELERRVRSGAAAAAFSLFPTAFADVMAVADAGDVMPPKSTWFEPKLADGLLSLPLAGAA